MLPSLYHQGYGPVAKLCLPAEVRAIANWSSIIIRGCALLMAFTAWTEPALARSYLNCLAKKVVIVDNPKGSTSSYVGEHLGFWIDEAAKTLVQARPRGTVPRRS
jgi:hypothetical protein